jgi:hypothetical protein
MALSWALHDVTPSSLQPGDHIYRWSSLIHVHHGIVLEAPRDNKDSYDRIMIMHLSNNGGVEAKKETLATFLGKTKNNGGGSLKSARYGVPPIEVWIKRSGTCYAEASAPVNEVLARANSLLERHCVFRAFRGATSEDIAFWCKTGKTRSAAPNHAGGTNYAQASLQSTDRAEATHAPQVPAPQASSSDTEATVAGRMADVVETDPDARSWSPRVMDPDAFLLLQEGNESQQVSTPCRIEILANDKDLEEYEVVDLPPWLSAEHYPAVVNAHS